MYFRDVNEPFELTKYKIPGDHVMTNSQFDENQHQHFSDIQAKTEMPPICVPRMEIDTYFEHKSKLVRLILGNQFFKMGNVS